MHHTLNEAHPSTAQPFVAQCIQVVSRRHPLDPELMKSLAWLHSALDDPGAREDIASTKKPASPPYSGLGPMLIAWTSSDKTRYSTFRPGQLGQAFYAYDGLKKRREQLRQDLSSPYCVNIPLIDELLHHPVIGRFQPLESHLREHCPPSRSSEQPRAKSHLGRWMAFALLIATTSPLAQYLVLTNKAVGAWCMHHSFLVTSLPMFLTTLCLAALFALRTRNTKTALKHVWFLTLKHSAPNLAMTATFTLLTGSLIHAGLLTELTPMLLLVHLACVLMGVIGITQMLITRPIVEPQLPDSAAQPIRDPAFTFTWQPSTQQEPPLKTHASFACPHGDTHAHCPQAS